MSETFIAPKKYELVRDDFIDEFGHKLFRIRALSNFGKVKAGELGGYIEREKNLSHSGSCWVYEGARVLDHAQILDNAQILGKALVCNMARVAGNAQVLERAWVCDQAQIFGAARILGRARVSVHASVSGEGQVSGNAQIACHAQISGNAKVLGKLEVSGRAHLSSTAKVSSDKDFIDFSSFHTVSLTVYRTQSGGIEVTHKSLTHKPFCGTPEAFLQTAAQHYGDSDLGKRYLCLFESAQSQLLQARRAKEAEENMTFDNLLEAMVKLPDAVKKQALRDAAQARSTGLFAETYERLLQAQTGKALQKATEYARHLPLYKS